MKRLIDYFWWLKTHYRKILWTYAGLNLIIGSLVFLTVFLFSASPRPKSKKDIKCEKFVYSLIKDKIYLNDEVDFLKMKLRQKHQGE